MKDLELESAVDCVRSQVNHAGERYGPFKSSHEGLGVLTEEFDELKDEIRANDLRRIRIEAIQVSAVALRIAVCCEDEEFKKRSRK